MNDAQSPELRFPQQSYVSQLALGALIVIWEIKAIKCRAFILIQKKKSWNTFVVILWASEKSSTRVRVTNARVLFNKKSVRNSLLLALNELPQLPIQSILAKYGKKKLLLLFLALKWASLKHLLFFFNYTVYFSHCWFF